MPEPYVGKEFLRQQNNKQKTLTSNLRPRKGALFYFSYTFAYPLPPVLKYSYAKKSSQIHHYRW